jgi:phage gpG-like protein
MANCQDIYTFLTQVSNKSVTQTLPGGDLATLQQLNLIQIVGATQYAQLVQDVQSLAPEQQTLAQKSAARAQLAAQLQQEMEQTHSMLFHFEGKEKQDAALQKEAQDQASLQAADSDLTAEETQYNQNLGKKALLDTLTPYGGGYVGLTSLGMMSTRDLGTRLYRVSDLPFASYMSQTQEVDRELNDIANQSSQYFSVLLGPLPQVDRSYLWAISIGLAKRETDIQKGATGFLDAYNGLASLAHNDENRLMSAEILAASPRSVGDSVPLLKQLDGTVRHMGIPKESSLGVASIILLGQRGDGTFATDNLQNWLKTTPSYESAALMAIVNRPVDEIGARFMGLRSMFGGWGYAPSDDVELSSAYLAVSDMPMDGMSPKLAVLTRGLGAYLQYPLVASAIMASIPVLEANETLQLLEEAYTILGRRAMGLAQTELICLAVRMIHGIRAETVSGLDTTATAVPAPPVNFHYMPGMWFFFVPVFVGHGAYFSTYSAMSGAHPAHIHAMGGGVGAGAG